MLYNYSAVLLFLAIAIGFLAMTLFIARLLRPHNPSPLKTEPYDCGEPAVGAGYRQFNMRFYLVAFVFVIFDVEIAFMYPVTLVFKELVHQGLGLLAFIEITIFVLILMVGFIYAWSQGGLDWVHQQIKSEITKN